MTKKKMPDKLVRNIEERAHSLWETLSIVAIDLHYFLEDHCDDMPLHKRDKLRDIAKKAMNVALGGDKK